MSYTPFHNNQWRKKVFIHKIFSVNAVLIKPRNNQPINVFLPLILFRYIAAQNITTHTFNQTAQTVLNSIMHAKSFSDLLIYLFVNLWRHSFKPIVMPIPKYMYKWIKKPKTEQNKMKKWWIMTIYKWIK